MSMTQTLWSKLNSKWTKVHILVILLGHRYLTKKLTTNGLFLLKFFYFLFIAISNAKLRHWNLRWKITRFTAAFLGRCFLRLPLRNQTDSLLDMVTMVGIELPIWSGLGRNFNVSNCRLVQTVCLMLSATTKTGVCSLHQSAWQATRTGFISYVCLDVFHVNCFQWSTN